MFYELYMVNNVSVTWPHYETDQKDGYLCDNQELVPDCLIPIAANDPLWINKNYTVLWITIRAPFPGDFEIRLNFKGEENPFVGAAEEATTIFSAHVLPSTFKMSLFPNTVYIDPIALADYYHLPMFCDKHWNIIGEYMKMAAKNGITGIIAPAFTPIYDEYPRDDRRLDLVEISYEQRHYTFHYERFDSWVGLAKKCGIKKFTIPPIFPTLEGPQRTRFFAKKDRHIVELFPDEELPYPHYMAFLRKYLRGLTQHLKDMHWIQDFTFQFTTVPLFAHEKLYRLFRPSMRDVVRNCPMQDYQVTYGFYMTDMVSDPVVTLHEMSDYMINLEDSVTGCFDIISDKDIINQLIATPSVRLRALGLLGYKLDLGGFFNLGYNYFPAGSNGETTSPFMVTDYGGRYPSGSLSLVYPGLEQPYPSIRLKQMFYALQDMSVLRKLEGQMSRNRLLTMIERDFPVDLDKCSLKTERFWKLRNKIYEFYEHHMSKMK
ncbi:MAG: DUF4091 domain-containing protein, partial [Clostridia bacterium]|nr:DUF4091 domain-containing protein [Clostridia bacterium]